jgi:MFS family permease
MARAKIRANRERPLGTAIGWGVAATLGMALLIFAVLMAMPGSAVHNFFDLCLHNPSATLPFSQLYQDWSAKIQVEEALLVTPLSLLCGGLTLGRLAPRYASRRRVLLSGAMMAFGILVLCLAFDWVNAVHETNLLADSQGGMVARLSAPVSYIVRQTLWVAAWTAVCVLGAALGQRLRDRRLPVSAGSEAASGLRVVPR